MNESSGRKEKAPVADIRVKKMSAILEHNLRRAVELAADPLGAFQERLVPQNGCLNGESHLERNSSWLGSKLPERLGSLCTPESSTTAAKSSTGNTLEFPKLSTNLNGVFPRREVGPSCHLATQHTSPSSIPTSADVQLAVSYWAEWYSVPRNGTFMAASKPKQRSLSPEVDARIPGFSLKEDTKETEAMYVCPPIMAKVSEVPEKSRVLPLWAGQKLRKLPGWALEPTKKRKKVDMGKASGQSSELKVKKVKKLKAENLETREKEPKVKKEVKEKKEKKERKEKKEKQQVGEMEGVNVLDKNPHLKMNGKKAKRRKKKLLATDGEPIPLLKKKKKLPKEPSIQESKPPLRTLVEDRGEGKRPIKRRVRDSSDSSSASSLNSSPSHSRGSSPSPRPRPPKGWANHVAPPAPSASVSGLFLPLKPQLYPVIPLDAASPSTLGTEGQEKIPPPLLDPQCLPLTEFSVGDVVWGKSGLRSDPWWPAVVVDPTWQAPPGVRDRAVAGRICVMFLGPTGSKATKATGGRDYAWVKQGMVCPYIDFLVKFEGQPLTKKQRTKDFRIACEEAALVEAGLEETLWEMTRGDVGLAEGQSQPLGAQDDLCQPVTGEGEPAWHTCGGCGGTVQSDPSSKAPAGRRKGDGLPEHICKPCAKLYKSQQYCPVCMKVWMPNEKGNWVGCDGCEIWVHAECAKISSKKLMELQENAASYFCPNCTKEKLQLPAAAPKKEASPAAPAPPRPSGGRKVPEELPVTCSGVKGIYLTLQHRMRCLCSECSHSPTALMSVGEFESHTGCRGKKWKYSIRVANHGLTLGEWLVDELDKGATGLGFSTDVARKPRFDSKEKDSKRTPVVYEPIEVRWTSERCAVCDIMDDFEDNKMVICNRCQMGVHEECYGLKSSSNDSLPAGGSWVCRDCEMEAGGECCLCPIKGGALKPTTLPGVWAHVTCAWWVPETKVRNVKKMEPIEGVQSVHPDRFRLLGCSVCRQPHGACIQCDGAKCHVAYHPLCARKAGYCLEFRDNPKTGGFTSTSFCPKHSPPCADVARPFLLAVAEAQRRQLAKGGRLRGAGNPGPRLAASAATAATPLAEETKEATPGRDPGSPSPPIGAAALEDERGPPPAARCRPYPSWREQAEEAAAAAAAEGRGGAAPAPPRAAAPPVPYRVSGFSRHSLREVAGFRAYFEPLDFVSLHERIKHVQSTFWRRVCFGKSGIHKWGLMARHFISEGEMVFDYRGTEVRQSVADLREKKYKKQGKDCYLFKINDQSVIDATENGNIGRLINHSCAPNCYSKIVDVDETVLNGCDAESFRIRSRIVIIARKDIAPGEELTYDYRFAKEEKDKVPCLCGAPDCRRFMN